MSVSSGAGGIRTTNLRTPGWPPRLASADPSTYHSDLSLVDLTVVIVNYNVCEFLKQALTSVATASAGLQVETIVVDNNSADGSAQMVRELFPDVALIDNSENVGFGRANNQALRIASGRYVLLLNPDTIIQEDTLGVMVRFLDQHEDAGAVGCKILNPDGSFALESRRSFPTPGIALARMSGLSKLLPRSKLFGRYNLTYIPNDQVCEVDALSGSCMMLRRSVVDGSEASRVSPDDAGSANTRKPLLFDEQFFMYGEDLDLCYRIQKEGWKLYYEPATQIIHYKGESTKKGDLRYVRLFYGAMLLFATKHFHGRYAGLLIFVLRAGIFGRASLSAFYRLLRRLTPALADFSISALCFLGVAVWRFAGRTVPSQLVTTVTPVFAFATVSALALMGAYRFGHRTKIRYAIVGALFGLISIAALSFFFKQIAFSRVVVGIGTASSAILMAGWRLIWRGDRERSRRALLVGPRETAVRLHEMLSVNPAPPFDLMGYIDVDRSESVRERPGESAQVRDDGVKNGVQNGVQNGAQNGAQTEIRNVGRLNQLRDIARFEQAGCMIFVPGSLSNEEIFGWMQTLRDLPIQFKMLGSTESHVIGKSSIDQLALPALVEAEQALGLTRSNIRHRLFDVAVALVLLLSTPLLFVGSLAGIDRARLLLSRIGMLPSVVTGSRSIVGFDENTSYRPPEKLGIKPGLFSVTHGSESPGELDRRYGFYAVRQSAGIDWAIVRKRLSE